MIISKIDGGIGNQLFRYAAGRRLAHKWDTEFKLDISPYAKRAWPAYALNAFDIKGTVATTEEIQSLKKFKEKRAWHFWPEVLEYPDEIYISGAWEDERYFSDIADVTVSSRLCK
ncbi:MAG: hypothetical protein IKZ53_05055 [Selenomonadaceae bacterium]|nr:hypothetical protein [Selenomonadaceae bacterium]